MRRLEASRQVTSLLKLIRPQNRRPYCSLVAERMRGGDKIPQERNEWEMRISSTYLVLDVSIQGEWVFIY